MGVMTGIIKQNEFVVMDAIPLPVEGTETRVNAMAAGYEYMVNYLTSLQRVGRKENIIGWYHSHPGYGCWLSGIDVGTQRQNQTFQDPFLALVIDPNRTIAAGKVEIGAFRTFPQSEESTNATVNTKKTNKALESSDLPPINKVSKNQQSIPSAKIMDFGVHADQYYQLEISYFKSSLDSKLLELLWNKYWDATLSQSSLLTNYDYSTHQIRDIALKTEAAANGLISMFSTATAAQKSYKIRDYKQLNETIKGGHYPTPQLSESQIQRIHQMHQEQPRHGVRMGRMGALKGMQLADSGNDHSGKENEVILEDEYCVPRYALLGTMAPNAEGSGEANPENEDKTMGDVKEGKRLGSSGGSSNKKNAMHVPLNFSFKPYKATNQLTQFKETSVYGVRTGNDQLHGLISQQVRDELFSNMCRHNH